MLDLDCNVRQAVA